MYKYKSQKVQNSSSGVQGQTMIYKLQKLSLTKDVVYHGNCTEDGRQNVCSCLYIHILSVSNTDVV